MTREKQTAARHAGRQRQRTAERHGIAFVKESIAEFIAAMKLPTAERDAYFEQRRQKAKADREKLRRLLPALERINPQLAGSIRQTIEDCDRIDAMLEQRKKHDATP